MEEVKWRRLNLEIPPDMHQDLRHRLPTGTVSEIVRKLIESMFSSVEREGDILIYKILQGKVKIVPLDQERSNLEQQ